MGKNWLPLEANPDTLTSYCRTLGLEETLAFHDVLGVESWALEMVPSPVKAILLLFPISEASEIERRTTSTEPNASIYFMKQTIGNACGTIGVLHTLINLCKSREIRVDPNSYIARMLARTDGMDPLERGMWLETDTEIEKAHQEKEIEGQSVAPSADGADVDTHFVTFVLGEDNSSIFELDGRREGPVLRGRCDNASEFAEKVLHVIKSVHMSANPEDIRFSILALAQSL